MLAARIKSHAVQVNNNLTADTENVPISNMCLIYRLQTLSLHSLLLLPVSLWTRGAQQTGPSCRRHSHGGGLCCRDDGLTLCSLKARLISLVQRHISRGVRLCDIQMTVWPEASIWEKKQLKRKWRFWNNIVIRLSMYLYFSSEKSQNFHRGKTPTNQAVASLVLAFM